MAGGLGGGASTAWRGLDNQDALAQSYFCGALNTTGWLRCTPVLLQLLLLQSSPKAPLGCQPLCDD